MSDNIEFFRETADRILSDTIDAAQIRAAENRALPVALFDALRENGILSMLAPEAQGGIGATIAEAMAILRASGDAAAPGPLLETILGNGLLGLAGQPVDGALMTLAVVPDGLPTAAGQFTVEVPWAGSVDHILLIGPSASGTRIARTQASAWQITSGEDASGEPRDTLRCNSTLAMELFDLDLPFDEVLRQASLLRGGQMLGAMEWAYRRSVEYAMERQQFGREIAKFQVVQQMLAELADHVLAATVLLEAAAESSTAMMTSAARSRLADATDCAITVTHQVHGAIGFSVEYALNYRTRRLMAWRDTYGSIPFWRNRLGQMLISCNRETLWHELTAGRTA